MNSLVMTRNLSSVQLERVRVDDGRQGRGRGLISRDAERTRREARLRVVVRVKAMRMEGVERTRAKLRRRERASVIVESSEREMVVLANASTVKKPRLPALDSIRFFFIAYIGVGHFIACATKNSLALAALVSCLHGSRRVFLFV